MSLNGVIAIVYGILGGAMLGWSLTTGRWFFVIASLAFLTSATIAFARWLDE